MHDLLNHKELNELLIRPFSWMLIHSLWQAAFWSAFLSATLKLVRESSSALRYNLVLVVFCLFLVSCAVTFAYERPSLDSLKVASVNVDQEYTVVQYQQHFNTQILSNASVSVTRYAPIIALLWLILFAYRSAQLLQGMVYLKRTKHKLTENAGSHWQTRLAILCDQLKLHVSVRLLTSGLVKTPVVIGHLKPLILIPMALMADLPPGQIEAILLHELAHIRRKDYLVNLLQTVTEAFFCFNPGLLWLSTLLREERENCCDDVTLAHVNNRQDLADALISCKEYEIYGDCYSIAFPGRKNLLLHRIKRILGHPTPAKTGLAGYSAAFVLGLIVLLGTVTLAKIKVAALPAQKSAKTVVHARDIVTKPPVKEIAFKTSAPKHKTPVVKFRTVTKKTVHVSAVSPVLSPDSLSDQQRAANDRLRAARDRDLAMQNIPLRP